MATTQELETIAARLLPEVEPAAALRRTNLFLARVMSAGNWQETNTVVEHFGEPAMRAVLNKPPRKIFDRQAWNFWHHYFQLGAPVMPDSFFTVYPWFKDRSKAKGPNMAAMIDHVPDYNSTPIYSCEEIDEFFHRGCDGI